MAIKNNTIIANVHENYLCLILPCLLWGLNDYLCNHSNGKYWNCEHTINQFPEIEVWIEKIKKTSFAYKANQLRIQCLEEAIKQLTK